MDIEENFVGREKQIKDYTEFSSSEPPPWMLTITGIAGTGKSTLVRKFLSKESEEVGTILLDFENNKEILEDPLALLKFLVEEIRAYCSNEAVANFHKKLAESNDAITKTIAYVDKALTLQISKAEEASIPTGSIKTELEEQKTINRKELERQHSTNVRDLATRLFYKILNSCSKERLIFIFDTCELLLEPIGEAVGIWLMDEVLPMLQIRFSKPCFVVFAGRELPTSKSINNSDQISYELPNLTKDELKEYLGLAGVTSDTFLENAFKMTYGHALCVSIIGALWKKTNNVEHKDWDKETISTEFQDKFNERVAVDLIDERILLRIESPLKELIRFSALLREFSRPLLEATLTDIDKEKIPEWFEQLIGYSFIKPKEDFHFALHNLLREVLVPKLHKSDEQQVKEYHKRIRDFIEKEKGSRTAEWHYHNIAYDEAQGMAAWKEDIEQAQYAHKETLEYTLLQVVDDRTTILDLEESRILRDTMKQRYKSLLPTSEEREADIGTMLKEISRDPEATLDERSKALGKLFIQQSTIAEEKPSTASNGHKEQPIVAPTLTPQKQPLWKSRRSALIVFLVLLLIAASILAYTTFINHQGTIAHTCNPANTEFVASDAHILTVANNEHIGLSDGTFAFDTNRPGGRGDLKRQAADKFKACDNAGAQSLWNQASSLDTSDAETLIYKENQSIIASGRPYITFVVGTTLTGNDASIVATGRDNLQGAYVAQKTFNDGFRLPGSVAVRLLIANSGSQSSYAATVATQIVDAAKKDKSIVGVIGWPYSSSVREVVPLLAQAHIPLVSPTASSDELTGISPYFFRVAPTNINQAKLGVVYAQQVLHAKKVALFVDPNNVDSENLAQDFRAQFLANGKGNVVSEVVYTTGRLDTPSQLLNSVFAQKADLIYFAGNVSDVSVLLNNLPTSGPFAHIQVLGGAGLYQVGTDTYPPTARPGFNRLHFTAFAYPDTWGIFAQGEQSPGFFSVYKQTFDPGNTHSASPYGYSRADNDTLLSYDATLALLQGSDTAIMQRGDTFTGDDLRQGLSAITGANAIQGVSGQIAFDAAGDAINKTVVMLYVDPNGFIKIERIQGCFVVGHCTT